MESYIHLDFLSEIPIEVWIAGVLGLYMAWAIGANDVANAMGFTPTSTVLDQVRSHCWRCDPGRGKIFEFAGAFSCGRTCDRYCGEKRQGNARYDIGAFFSVIAKN